MTGTERTGESESRSGRRRFVRLRPFAAPLLLAIALYLCRIPLLQSVVWPLVLEDREPSANNVLILGGENAAAVAAQLLADGRVERVLLVERMPNRLVRMGIRKSRLEAARSDLLLLGVKEGQMERLPGMSRTDTDIARAVRDWLDRQPDRSLLVVCGLFDGKRLQMVFDRELQGPSANRVSFLGIRSSEWTAEAWWRSKRGALGVIHGYLKLSHYYAFKGEEPAWREWDPDKYQAQLRLECDPPSVAP